MNKKFVEKFTAVVSAVCMISVGIASVNAAEIDDGFESVTKNAQSSDSSFPSAYSAIGYSLVDENGLPSNFSSKNLGFVTPIKAQQYNDCWAVAGTEGFETKLLKLGYPVTEMSHDHANASSTTQTNGKGWQRKYRDGGFTNIYPGYLTSWQGGAEIADVGKIDFSKNIHGDDMTADKTKYGTTKLRYLDGADSNEIKQAIIDNGSVTASYATSNKCFNNAGTTYFMPQSYDGDYVGHTISIVGWNDNLSRYRFSNGTGVLPQNNGAWLVRNSWGDNNTMGGYFWLSYEDKYIFGEKYSPNFTIDEVTEITDDMTLLQDERYGATYSFNYVDSNDITFINCFDFGENSRTLDKVLFETKSNGADYEIYYIPVRDGVPSNDESEWKSVASGKVAYSGYQSVDANGFVAPLGRGAVGVRIKTNSEELSQLGVGEWLTSATKMTFLNDSSYGNSYIKYDGATCELLDWYKTERDDTLGGTFVIKAVALKNDKILNGDVDLDGDITVKDATIVQKYIVKLEQLDNTQLCNADCDGDGVAGRDLQQQRRIVRVQRWSGQNTILREFDFLQFTVGAVQRDRRTAGESIPLRIPGVAPRNSFGAEIEIDIAGIFADDNWTVRNCDIGKIRFKATDKFDIHSVCHKNTSGS